VATTVVEPPRGIHIHIQAGISDASDRITTAYTQVSARPMVREFRHVRFTIESRHVSGHRGMSALGGEFN
jgi:hypothetical protein